MELPLLFIRVRVPEQIPDLVARLGPAVRLLSGFVLPKFTEERRKNWALFQKLFKDDDRFIIQKEHGKSSAFSFT